MKTIFENYFPRLGRPRFVWVALAGCLLFASTAESQTPPAPAAQPAASGLNVILKDGKTVNSPNVRRSGNNIMVTSNIGGGVAEVGYPVANVARIEFPEPPQIKTATDLLTQGKHPEVLALLDPIANYYSPFRDVPGNWWAPAARLRLTALIKLQRDRDAEALIGELSSIGNDPETARSARVQLAAGSARKGQHEKALAVFDEVIAESKSDETLALAWTSKGESHLALKEWEPALLAFLHVPVYYPFQKLELPPALLGSARARIGIQDLLGAEKTFSELIEQFPSSPEAAAAKAELQKLTTESSGKG